MHWLPGTLYNSIFRKLRGRTKIARVILVPRLKRSTTIVNRWRKDIERWRKGNESEFIIINHNSMDVSADLLLKNGRWSLKQFKSFSNQIPFFNERNCKVWNPVLHSTSLCTQQQPYISFPPFRVSWSVKWSSESRTCVRPNIKHQKLHANRSVHKSKARMLSA